ncbi:hypothetical protein CN325_00045 [Bacillus thuringiensis]|nr:hypothetical protein CN325_00045 [Bacillus thuringiensis]
MVDQSNPFHDPLLSDKPYNVTLLHRDSGSISHLLDFIFLTYTENNIIVIYSKMIAKKFVTPKSLIFKK